MKIDNYIEHDELFTLSEETKMTPKLMWKYIEAHKELCDKRYEKLYNAYIGNYPIRQTKEKDAWKPDNRIVVNFAKYMVDTMNGFFIGIPIKVTSKNEKVNEYLNYLDIYNDQDDNNAELSRICSIYGKGYELYYANEKSELCITYLNPMEGFMIFDDTVARNPLYFVHYYKDSEGIIQGKLYDSDCIYDFNEKNKKSFVNKEKEHGFEGVPAAEFIENEERMSIFEPGYSAMNQYNKVLSEKANDVDYFADAYLKILGAKVDTESQKNIKANRIINFEGEESEKVIVEFLEKPDSDTTQESLLNRLERHIYQTCMIANINDENFGTASGISLKYKLLSMSNLAKTKERKFTSGMNRRYRLLFSNKLSDVGKDDWLSVEYKFTQNYPANVLEEAQIATQLSGVTSKETQLKVLSIVEDVQSEMDAKAKENDPISYNTDFPTNRTEEE